MRHELILPRGFSAKHIEWTQTHVDPSPAIATSRCTHVIPLCHFGIWVGSFWRRRCTILVQLFATPALAISRREALCSSLTLGGAMICSATSLERWITGTVLAVA